MGRKNRNNKINRRIAAAHGIQFDYEKRRKLLNGTLYRAPLYIQPHSYKHEMSKELYEEVLDLFDPLRVASG